MNSFTKFLCVKTFSGKVVVEGQDRSAYMYVRSASSLQTVAQNRHFGTAFAEKKLTFWLIKFAIKLAYDTTFILTFTFYILLLYFVISVFLCRLWSVDHE